MVGRCLTRWTSHVGEKLQESIAQRFKKKSAPRISYSETQRTTCIRDVVHLALSFLPPKPIPTQPLPPKPEPTQPKMKTLPSIAVKEIPQKRVVREPFRSTSTFNSSTNIAVQWHGHSTNHNFLNVPRNQVNSQSHSSNLITAHQPAILVKASMIHMALLPMILKKVKQSKTKTVCIDSVNSNFNHEKTRTLQQW